MLWTGRTHCQRQVAFFKIQVEQARSFFFGGSVEWIAKIYSAEEGCILYDVMSGTVDQVLNLDINASISWDDRYPVNSEYNVLILVLH